MSIKDKGQKKVCLVSHVEYKAVDVAGKKEHHIYGFVSAPCVDKDNDYIGEDLQEKLVGRINNGFANRGSWNHDFLIEDNYLPVASAKAELRMHPDLNKQAAYVDVVLDPDSPKFNEIVSHAEKGEIKGFSIEYPKDPKSHSEFMGDKLVRVFDEIPAFGFGIIGGDFSPRNDMAYADGFEYKAYFDKKNPEVKGKMPEEEEKKEAEAKEVAAKEAEAKKEKEVAETKAKEEAEVKAAKEKEAEAKAAAEAKGKSDSEIKAEAELKEFQEFKAAKAKSEKATEFKEMIDAGVKAGLKEMAEKGSPYLVPGGKFDVKGVEDSLKSYKGTMEDDKSTLNEKYKAAAKLHNQLDPMGITQRNTGFKALSLGSFEVTGPLQNCFEVKASAYKAQLEHDTHKTLDTDYYQNAAELRDIYDPVIRSHLNDRTTYYGLLKKIDASGFADRYGFTAWIDRVAGAGGNTSTYNYDEGDTLTGQKASMLKMQIPFMWYAAVVQVSGQMIAASRGRGSIGDVFSKQVERASTDLLRGINADLFGNTAGFTAGGKVLGLQYLLASASDLYGLERNSTYTTLQGTTTAKSGTPNPAKTDLRKAMRVVEKNGAFHSDLMVVCDHIQKDKILGLMDEAQRLTTVPRAGFEGMPSFDDVPIHSDDQCPDGFIYILDMRHMGLAVQVAPTFEDLAKTDDSKKGFVKTYFAHFSSAPNHNYLYTGFATT